jgi:uncharacterized protein
MRKKVMDMPVQLDPVLLEVLACPAPHHAPLAVGTPADPDAAALTCTECGRVFPVRSGIPVLLLDEAMGGPTGKPVRVEASS